MTYLWLSGVLVVRNLHCARLEIFPLVCRNQIDVFLSMSPGGSEGLSWELST